MVYQPAEDSYLLQKEVKKRAFGSVLEIGTGSGILAETAALKKNVTGVTAVDIQKRSIDYAKKHVSKEAQKKIFFYVSDIFSKVNIKKGKFDTIIFNPPYLPLDKREPASSRLETTGGKHGYEIIERFLNSVSRHLKQEGIVLLLFSTLTGQEKVDQFIHENMLKFKPVAEEKISFETLYVYEIKKSRLLKKFEAKGISDIHAFMRGHRGQIYKGKLGKREVSMKVQRPDIGVKGTVDHEVKMLRKLNKLGIGPEIIHAGKDWFIAEFVPGDFIIKFFEKKKTTKKQIRKILADVMQQMRQLDILGLNKEEMHHPFKHVVVTPGIESVLLDFERCKETKKPKNVTQFIQFINSGLLRHVFEKKNIGLDHKSLMEKAQAYKGELKKGKAEALFEEIMDLIK